MTEFPLRVSVAEHEKEQPLWWLQHHKANVRYLCIRIQKLIEDPEDEEYREFFEKHFKATLPAFLSSTGYADAKESEKND